MFDYQAGEKYRMTLIMVGLAGLLAGIFFAVLLMPTPEPVRRRPMPAYMSHPDVTGRPANASPYGAGAAQAMTPTAAPPVAIADPTVARTLIEQWLPLAWDLSAGSAADSQEKAIAYMTKECADAYRQNIWNPELAKQINEAGLHSSFQPSRIEAGDLQPDGSVVVFVDGMQVLSVPGKGAQSRPVKLEYLIRQTTEGLRIAGISEGGKGL